MTGLSRVRIRYHKKEGLRYTGSLDMQRIWERGLRRAGVPVAYSQGFHPQPRIQQACPLPLGFLSTTEIVDIWINQPEVDEQKLKNALMGSFPDGIELQEVEPVELNTPALQSLTRYAEYRAELLRDLDAEQLAAQARSLLQAVFLPRERRGKPYDLRPLILDLSINHTGPGHAAVFMRLSAAEGATGRPEEVLLELELDPAETRIIRTALGFSSPVISPGA